MNIANIDLTPIFQAIIALLAAIITWKVIPWINARATKEQKANLRAAIRVLVYAAEQIYGAGKGAEKLDYVIERLKEKGYTVDRGEIEAAVYEAFNDISIDLPDTEIEHWSIEELRKFCKLNGIDASACESKQDYLDLIAGAGEAEGE